MRKRNLGGWIFLAFAMTVSSAIAQSHAGHSHSGHSHGGDHGHSHGGASPSAPHQPYEKGSLEGVSWSAMAGYITSALKQGHLRDAWLISREALPEVRKKIPGALVPALLLRMQVALVSGYPEVALEAAAEAEAALGTLAPHNQAFWYELEKFRVEAAAKVGDWQKVLSSRRVLYDLVKRTAPADSPHRDFALLELWRTEARLETPEAAPLFEQLTAKTTHWAVRERAEFESTRSCPCLPVTLVEGWTVYVDPAGKPVSDPYIGAERFRAGVAIVEREHKFGLLGEDLRPVVPEQYESLVRLKSREDRFVAGRRNYEALPGPLRVYYNLLDAEGSPLLSSWVEQIQDLGDGTVFISVEGNRALAQHVSADGVPLRTEYEDVVGAGDALAGAPGFQRVEVGETWGIMGPTGAMVLRPQDWTVHDAGDHLVRVVRRIRHGDGISNGPIAYFDLLKNDFVVPFSEGTTKGGPVREDRILVETSTGVRGFSRDGARAFSLPRVKFVGVPQLVEGAVVSELDGAFSHLDAAGKRLYPETWSKLSKYRHGWAAAVPKNTSIPSRSFGMQNSTQPRETFIDPKGVPVWQPQRLRTMNGKLSLYLPEPWLLQEYSLNRMIMVIQASPSLENALYPFPADLIVQTMPRSPGSTPDALRDQYKKKLAGLGKSLRIDALPDRSVQGQTLQIFRVTNPQAKFLKAAIAWAAQWTTEDQVTTILFKGRKGGAVLFKKRFNELIEDLRWPSLPAVPAASPAPSVGEG